MEIREKFYVGNSRREKEWPLARTKYSKLFLNAGKLNYIRSQPEKEAQAHYNVNDLCDRTQNRSI